MRTSTKLWFAAALLAVSYLCATKSFADVAISGLPAASALSGTELVPVVQGGTTSKATVTQIKTQVLGTQANATVLGNFSGSTAAPTALNPLAVANMMSATIGVTNVSASNVTSLSGTPTYTNARGASATAVINSTILLTNQTTASQNGLWIVNSGAWTRPINFPSGYVIQAFCILAVYDTNSGFIYQLNTAAAGTAVTIDTSNQAWGRSTFQGTQTIAGFAKVSDGTSSTVAAGLVNGDSRTVGDCVTFSSTNGSLQDSVGTSGLTGTCMTVDGATYHPNGLLLVNPPTVSAGTLDANCTDTKCTVTGLVAATSVTVTFGQTYANWRPACVATAGAALATAPYISAMGSTAGPVYTSVTFSFAALTGSLNWICW